MKLTNVMIGRRPIPRGGLPVIGRPAHIVGLYVSVMHTGVTLAAIAGGLATDEILSDQDNILLSSFRPDKFD